uniref:Interleukin n=1 Tax=Sphenodon punctatus TaxID=8508 RepID=A0A8D0L5G9_SPHPU
MFVITATTELYCNMQLASTESENTPEKYLSSVPILYFILNSHLLSFFSNETGITIFILCCLSTYLPKTEAVNETYWQEVEKDLSYIANRIKSIDTLLYTADMNSEDCKVSVMKCFLLEMKVIMHESKDIKTKGYVKNLLKNANASLSSSIYQTMSTTNCQQCETYNEENVSVFIQTFKSIVQQFNKEKQH